MNGRSKRILRAERHPHDGKRTIPLHLPVHSARHKAKTEEHYRKKRHESEEGEGLCKQGRHMHILLQLFRLESKRVADDRDARPCHGKSREHGREEPTEDGKEYAACEGNAYDVVDERPEEI